MSEYVMRAKDPDAAKVRFYTHNNAARLTRSQVGKMRDWLENKEMDYLFLYGPPWEVDPYGVSIFPPEDAVLFKIVFSL